MATTTRNPGPRPTADNASPPPARKKRPEPERTAPVRQMTSRRRPPPQARSAPATAPQATAPEQAAPDRAAPEQAASQAQSAQAKKGVATTSDLVEHGRDLANAAISRTRKDAARSGEALFPDIPILSELPGAKDALHLAEGAIRTWFVLWTTVLRATMPLAQGLVPDGGKIVDTLRDLAQKALGEEPSAEEAAAHGPSKQAVSKQAVSERAISFTTLVKSARQARISLQIHRETTGAGLSVQPLFPVARDAARPPITEVSLSTSKDGRSPELQVSIPESQPPGRYLGAVFEEATGAVVGGLTIDLLG